MNSITEIAERVEHDGYAVINEVYGASELARIASLIEEADTSKATFRKDANLFAVRQFLKEIPGAVPYIFSDTLLSIIHGVFGTGFFLSKSIYFDKPGGSNWFVSYHQDLTISVEGREAVEGYGPWSQKQNQYAVQPPLSILEENFTIRIHLDDTDEANGALRVVSHSHKKGIYRPETINWQEEREATCSVPRGGIMIMKPLLLHASSRTTDDRQRRVIHLEFGRSELPAPLQWSERIALPLAERVS